MSRVETFLVDSSGVVTRVVDPTQEAPTPDAIIAIGPALPALLCVIYRTGGTENFKWHRTLAMTPEDAWEGLRAVHHLGYAGHVENYFASLAVGLPETYSPDFPLVQDWS
jgi:hypothetical protein